MTKKLMLENNLEIEWGAKMDKKKWTKRNGETENGNLKFI